MAKDQSVSIVSLDADGCMFHLGYQRSYIAQMPNSLITCNKGLINYMEHQIPANSQKILTLGSLRQTVGNDEYSKDANNTESAFDALTTISEEVNFKLDKFLLSDLVGKQQLGENFHGASQLNNPNCQPPKLTSWFPDRSKLLILYAQTHRAAANNSNSRISFHFFDDLHEEREAVLKNLSEFYKQHSDWLPKNVNLILNRYRGGRILSIATIQGTGEIDYYYQDNTLTLSDLVRDEMEKNEQRSAKLIELLEESPEEMIQFIKNRKNKGEKKLPYYQEHPQNNAYAMSICAHNPSTTEPDLNAYSLFSFKSLKKLNILGTNTNSIFSRSSNRVIPPPDENPVAKNSMNH